MTSEKDLIKSLIMTFNKPDGNSSRIINVPLVVSMFGEDASIALDNYLMKNATLTNPQVSKTISEAVKLEYEKEKASWGEKFTITTGLRASDIAEELHRKA